MSDPEKTIVYRKPTVKKELAQAVAEKPAPLKPTTIDLIKEVLARAPSLVEVQKNAWLYTEWLAELVRVTEVV
jgi:hypothetical protein